MAGSTWRQTDTMEGTEAPDPGLRLPRSSGPSPHQCSRDQAHPVRPPCPARVCDVSPHTLAGWQVSRFSVPAPGPRTWTLSVWLKATPGPIVFHNVTPRGWDLLGNGYSPGSRWSAGTSPAGQRTPPGPRERAAASGRRSAAACPAPPSRPPPGP